MTEVTVRTIEFHNGDGWEPVYQVADCTDGHPERQAKGKNYWKTVVWKIDDLWSRANAHDRVLESNGGHFNPYRFRFVEMPFDPEKHHLEEPPREYRS